MQLCHHPIPKECPAGGEGVGWGRPACAIPLPSAQRAAACAPHPGRGPPPPELGSPLRPWGRQPGLRAPRPLGVQRVSFCHLFYCCWAGKWVIRADRRQSSVARLLRVRVMLLAHRLGAGGFAPDGDPSQRCSMPIPCRSLSPCSSWSVHPPRLMIPAALASCLL